MNNLGQWRSLPGEAGGPYGGPGGAGGGGGSAFQPLPPHSSSAMQRPDQRRQITKNPHNMFGGGSGGGVGNSFGSSQLGFGGSGGGGPNGAFNNAPLSPTPMGGGGLRGGGGGGNNMGIRGSGMMSPGSGDMDSFFRGGPMDGPGGGGGGGPMEGGRPRLSPSNFGGGGGMNNPMQRNNTGHHGGGGGPPNMRFNNGYGNGGGPPNDGGGGGRYGGNFDRSMSNMEGNDRGGGMFDHFGDRKMSNGSGGGGGMFNRQTSVPTNMDGMMHNGGGGHGGGMGGPSRNGFSGGHDGGSGGGFGGGQNRYGRSDSPPMFGSGPNKGGPFNDMQIGTWEAGNSSSSSGGGNGMDHRSRNMGDMNGRGPMGSMGDHHRGGGMDHNMDRMGGDRGGMGGGGSGSGGAGSFEIGTFFVPTAQNGYGSGSGEGNRDGPPQRGIYHPQPNPATSTGGGPGIRETGIIEKLLHSYGFIQCCDRQARLFFHFSQFDGTIEHLKIGDPVEFEMTYDRRTGKPIASNVSKIAPEVVMSEERVVGCVTTETKTDPETGQVTAGRISYENRGECFFLPFTISDVEGNVNLTSGDKCSFQMATMARSGNLVARTIRLENPVAPVKYQGVVNSVKDDKGGTIERSDVVREIAFHFADCVNANRESGSGGSDDETPPIDLGDDVEFTIQTRDGKEVACDITALPRGTVVFEDVGAEYFTGQVLKPLDRHLKHLSASNAVPGSNGQEGEALSGRIKYRGEDRSEVEVLFGEKDQIGDFTLRHGDWVKFVIAVDRRDKLRRATRIELMDQSFSVSDERREQGKVSGWLNERDGVALMRCATRDSELAFNVCECLDVHKMKRIEIGDECEFTAALAETADQAATASSAPGSNGMVAIRIKRLPSGTVEFDAVIHKDVIGKVEIEPPRKVSSASVHENGESDVGDSSAGKGGKVVYDLNGLDGLEIPIFASDCEHRVRKDDVIRFDINQCRATKLTNAVNIRIMESPGALREAKESAQAAAAAKKENSELRRAGCQGGGTHQGYIAALKDGFGFVETLTREKEIFFHFSNVEGKTDNLGVGMEVEYTIFNREKGGKVSAEGVKVLTKGSIPPLKAKEEVLNGKVVRPLRSVNPDQEDYCGLIQVAEEGTIVAEYEFGIASLVNKKELLQVGDPVQFQLHVGEDFAVNIQATREKLRSYVEAMKGPFGFLAYEHDEGKKLFFHTSEVEGGELLAQGDEVEFVVVTNRRSGKHSACCVRKLSSSKRPERLISKLKTMNLEDAARGGKKIVVIRQPKGPESGQGFRTARNV